MKTNAQIAAAMNNLRYAFERMESALDENYDHDESLHNQFDTQYPFNMSFDELTTRVDAWAHTFALKLPLRAHIYKYFVVTDVTHPQYGYLLVQFATEESFVNANRHLYDEHNGTTYYLWYNQITEISADVYHCLSFIDDPENRVNIARTLI